MTRSSQKWPGYRQDREDDRLRQERQRERQIQARLQGRAGRN